MTRPFTGIYIETQPTLKIDKLTRKRITLSSSKSQRNTFHKTMGAVQTNRYAIVYIFAKEQNICTIKGIPLEIIRMLVELCTYSQYSANSTAKCQNLTFRILICKTKTLMIHRMKFRMSNC